MSLRLKLTISAAILSILVATSVGILGYLSTSKTVTDDAKQNLSNILSRFADPDGRLVDSLCGNPFDNQGDRFTNQYATTLERPDAGLLGGAPGVTIQCIDTSGATVASLGPAVDKDIHVPNCGPERNTVNKAMTIGPDDHKYIVSTLAANNYCVVALRSLSETSHSLNSIRNETIALGAIATAIAALIGLYAAWRATIPVLQLTRAAERIATTDDLNTPIEITGNDEVGRLARAFAVMLRALRHSREQQQRFVQDAGHELRTPLTSIRTNIDTLARHDDLSSDMKTCIFNDLREEIGEMADLVDELVLLGASTQGIVFEDIDIGASIEEVVQRWRRRTETPIELSIIDAITVPSNRVILSRAVSNLIDNAVKFAGSQPVEITIKGIEIEVHDHGPGIDEDDMQHVFERFYRSAAARSERGSGLGLAIVRENLNQVGANIAVRNHPDGGAVFTVTLPSNLLT